jgi:hypothetical protein
MMSALLVWSEYILSSCCSDIYPIGSFAAFGKNVKILCISIPHLLLYPSVSGSLLPRTSPEVVKYAGIDF